MLRELSIRNLAVIEQVDITFHNGFHVLTGETGAGKSILIDALGLIAGSRGSAEMIRYGCDRAEIEALFDLAPDHPVWGTIEKYGIAGDREEMLVIRRELSASGKSVSRINGQIVNLSMLREAGEKLINLHGQHEHQSLLRTEQHLEWLDLYAGKELAMAKNSYQLAYQRYVGARRQVKELEESARQNMHLLDLYKFQIEEITSAQLKLGEDECLVEEKSKLAYAERIMDNASEAYALLSGPKGLEAFSKALSKLEDIKQHDQSVLVPLVEQLQSAFYQAEDVVFQLRGYRDGIEANPERLAEIEDRLDLLRSFKRKYGDSIPEMLNYLKNITDAADKIENHEAHLKHLQQEEQHYYEEALQCGQLLSRLRKAAALKLSGAIEAELKQLQMSKTTFLVELLPLSGEAKLAPRGIDEAAFLISPNPGEPPKPLHKIASGGEMSRVMLALKAIFARIDQVPVLIFDEVDTGVSGRAAQSIAEKMSALSRQCQVFSITHLPQVACMADHHYEIIKHVTENRTATAVSELAHQRRIEELARMLGGVEVTQNTRTHAQEMIDLAEKRKGA